MKTLHLVGYHDAYPIKLDELRDEPCFKEGTFYLVEIPLDIQSINLMLNVKCESDLEAKLHTLGFDNTVSYNIAQLMNFKPAGMMPCATKTPDNGEEYGSLRDKEIMQLFKKALENLNYDNITFFGGSKHAKYNANELELETNEENEFPHKILYDLRLEQSRYNTDLRNKLTKAKLFNLKPELFV